jgi:hypothetical protein
MKRLNLLLHVTSSAGWWGAVAAFLALAVAGMTGDSHAACRAMAVTGWGAIVPLAVLSSATGLVQSLAGAWGLLRHWWVLFKIVVVLPCSLLLLLHLKALDACTAPTAGQMTLDAALALIVLLVPLALSVYKPRGLTPWGQRRT